MPSVFRFQASRNRTPSLGRDALPGDPPEGCPMVTPALAPLIVYAFRRVRRGASTEGAKLVLKARSGEALEAVISRERTADYAKDA